VLVDLSNEGSGSTMLIIIMEEVMKTLKIWKNNVNTNGKQK
jgi:hypothetical protein